MKVSFECKCMDLQCHCIPIANDGNAQSVVLMVMVFDDADHIQISGSTVLFLSTFSTMDRQHGYPRLNEHIDE